MKFKLKSALAGVATLAATGATLIGMAGAANAVAGGSTPAWDPDTPNAVGNVVFYDSSGNVVTGGSNLNHLFDFAAATGAGDAGAVKATMFFAVPSHLSPTGSWAKQQASGSTSYPSSTAPAPLTGPGFSNPLVTLASTDADLNNTVGGAFTLDSTAGYANIIQVRVIDNLGNAASKYFETDIAYNPSSATGNATADGVTVAPGSWAVIYPNITTTTGAVTANPPSPQNTTTGATAGSSTTLTDTITPNGPTSSVTGTVQFFDGTTAVGSPVAVAGNAAQTTVSAPSFGSHSYSAVFTPTGGTSVQGSTSPTLTYVVNAPKTATSTSITGTASAAQYGSASFTATETPTPSPDGGTFTIVATGPGASTATTTLGSPTESAGTGTLNITSLTLAPGSYTVTATFNPTSNTFAGSTSSSIPLTVTAPACPGAPSPDGLTCSDTQNIQATVNPGSLTITTPYTGGIPFVFPNPLTLNPAATALTTQATFPAASDPQIKVHSSLAGDPNWTVSVTDTNLTCIAGNCHTNPNSNDYQVINGENLGLTGGASDAPSTNFPGTVTFTDIPADSSVVGPADVNSNGLKGGPHTFATSVSGGNGTVNMHGTLTLNAPTATQDGTYAGTITFTVG